MLLSLCMIVRDAACCLARALNSVKELADELIVIDTGSRDGTEEIAREYGARFFSFEWDYNFSQARNFAIKKARGDWVLFLDADEELSNDYYKFRSLLKETDCAGFYLPVVNLDFSMDIYMPRLILRLFKREMGFYFQGRIDEQISDLIVKENRSIKIKVLQLPIIHYRNYYRQEEELSPVDFYCPEFSEGISAENPSHQILKDSNNFFRQGRLTLALNELEKGLQVAGRRDRKIFLANIILILLELKQFLRAEEIIREALSDFPGSYIFYFWRGYLNLQWRDYKRAIRDFREVLSYKGVTGRVKGATYFLMGLSNKGMNNLIEARFYLKKAFSYRFECKYFFSNIVDLFPGKRMNEIFDLIEGNNIRPDLVYLLLETCYDRGEYKHALNLFTLFQKSNKETDRFYYWKAKILIHHSEYKQAARFFKKIKLDFNEYNQVLDHLWIINLLNPVRKESRSVVNQLKLAGDNISYTLINVFNKIYFYGEETWIEFNNLLARFKFYKRALDYLEILIEYSVEKGIEIMLDILDSLRVKCMNKDVGRIFYKKKNWKRAYYYLKESLAEGETLYELIYLTRTCFQLGKDREARNLSRRIDLIAPQLKRPI